MRRVDFIDLARGVMSVAGYNEAQFQTVHFRQLRPLFANRLASAWERTLWPELMRVERRQFRAPWAAATAYTAGDELFHIRSQTYVQALQASTGQEPYNAAGTLNAAYWHPCQPSYSGDDWSATPAYEVGRVVRYTVDDEFYALHTSAAAGTVPTDDTKWGQLTPFVRNLDRAQAWEPNALGDVTEIWDRDPDSHVDARTVDYKVGDDTVYVGGTRRHGGAGNHGLVSHGVHPLRPWVEWRLPVPILKGDVFSGAADYAVGDQIYFSSSTTRGNFYDCIEAATAGESPDDEPDHWRLVEIPALFRRYLEQGVYADTLPGDQENERRSFEAALAERLLADQVSRLKNQLQQRTRFEVITR